MTDTPPQVTHDHAERGLKFYDQDPKALRRHLMEEHGYESEDVFGQIHMDHRENISTHNSDHYEALARRGYVAPIWEEEDEPEPTD